MHVLRRTLFRTTTALGLLAGVVAQGGAQSFTGPGGYSYQVEGLDAPSAADALGEAAYGESMRYIADAPARASIDFPNPLNLVDDFKAQALSAMEDCDYARYLTTAENLSNSWASVMGGVDNVDGGRDWAVPYMDPINAFITPAGTRAMDFMAQNEVRNAVYAFENLCNSVVSSRDTYNQLQEMRAQSEGILDMLTLMFRGFDTDEMGDERSHVSGNLVARLEALVPSIGETREDTVVRMMNDETELYLDETEARLEVLGSIQHDLRALEDDLYTYADTDEDGNWVCPEGFPTPSADHLWERHETVEGYSLRVCGPASPEQTNRVLAEIEVKKTEMRAMENDLAAKGLSQEAVHLYYENHMRRRDEDATIRAHRPF